MVTRLYESMFLVENARAKEDADGVMTDLKAIISRAGGEVVNIDKWDERKLMFEIRHQRRGTYFLSHWNGPGDAPAKVERQCRLSEPILRVLTLRDEDGIEISKPRHEVSSRRDSFRRGGGGGGRRDRPPTRRRDGGRSSR